MKPPTFTCAKPGCTHPDGPDCPAWTDWMRCVLASVSEGYCPLNHGRLTPIDPDDSLSYRTERGEGATVTAEGTCAPCARRWTIGESPGGTWFGFAVLWWPGD